ncbi:hypothetical protein ACFPAF_03430 [Hymenobacter endophyticus]|uniref:Uncharacterized protein n=1 Tax=Hymenobacter endophyticus TaxID=3076335 RepID=A0ABU3TDM6_9BACT|nr:hypothetical protein [Hymenobacter endophyticus]MDU0369432.1 hypothetical protein [Hymenobacter endophyticus]
MNHELHFADVVVVPPRSALAFTIRYSPETPAYQELVLEDASGVLAHWVISQRVKRLSKRPVLLWLLTTPPSSSPLVCMETGTVQSAPTASGTTPNLRQALTQGTLWLTFNGNLLRGYYRLQCLPAGCGQLWQLTPISRV